jgi:hypothetical protein
VPILAPDVSIRNNKPAGIAPIAMNAWIQPRIIKYFFVVFLD